MAAVNRRLLLLLLLRNRRAKRIREQQKYKKDIWVRRIFAERRAKGEYCTLIREMRLFDHEYFFKQFRMTPARFDHLLSLVGPDITKCSLRREVIPPGERLCLTLSYLVTGDAQISMASSYRISPTSVGRIIAETCEAIWNRLLEHGYMRSPSNESQWKKISEDHEHLWNFPNCVGAIDGKHIVMQAPDRAGSSF